jgi:hypothetical protein
MKPDSNGGFTGVETEETILILSGMAAALIYSAPHGACASAVDLDFLDLFIIIMG